MVRRTTCMWMAWWAAPSAPAARICSRRATWTAAACCSARWTGCARRRAASATRPASTCRHSGAPSQTPTASATTGCSRRSPTAARCAASTLARRSPRCRRSSAPKPSPAWIGPRRAARGFGRKSATPATMCGVTCRRASPSSTRPWCRRAIPPIRSARTSISKGGPTALATRRRSTTTNTTLGASRSASPATRPAAWPGTRAMCGRRTTPC